MVLLLETIIVIMNNIRWWWWWWWWSLRCFLVVVRGLHRPFILIHHHKTKILLNRSLPKLSFASLSLSLSLTSRRRRRERKRERERYDKKRWWSFYLRMMIFFPNALPSHHQENRFAPHNTLDAITNNKQKKRRRRRGSNSRTRWVFSNSPVSLLFTMLVYVLDISMLRLK
mgnify:CR=1 FL=1